MTFFINQFCFIAAPPVFVVKPGDKRLVKGSSVKFDCLAAGNPLPTLFWMKEAHGSGILLPGDGQEHVRVTPEGSLVIGEYN